MPTFMETVDQACVLLQRSGRVSMRALKREFSLDDESLEDLAEELIEVRQLAERDSNILNWIGETTASPRGTSEPADSTAGSAAGVEQPAAVNPAENALPDHSERRQLTVMFCDLVGSTELAQRIDPEELRDLMREYRSVCVEATKRFGGHVAQYLGDGVLIYFGYPQALEDAAGRAIRTGLQIQRVLAERSEDDRIDARVGIHTGLVVVGSDGSAEDSLALGPTTNVAARIESVATPGSVVVSDATLALCRGVFVTQSLGETHLKGIDPPLLLHEVETMAGVRGGAVVRPSTPMVGRDGEVGILLDRWEDVEDGRGQVVLVSGEAGMGKSRLIEALHDELSDKQHLWLDIQGSPYTSGSAFQPLIDLFSAGLSFGKVESPEEATELLVRGLEPIPGLRGESVIPYILALLSMPPSEKYPLPQTSADEQRERTFGALHQLMLNLSEQQAVVMVGEDLHWCDPSTIEYFERLVQQTATTRLMLVLTFRPEFRVPWVQSHVSELKLTRLGKRVTRKMITNAAGGHLPEPVLAELESRSDGVPLFIEELASGVVSSGVMTEQAGRFELHGSLRDLAIPATLQDSLMARLDRLSASKHVAQEAATLGREFSYELVEAVSNLDTPALRVALQQLVTAEILHQRGAPPDASYTFKHALLRDTAYESQLLSTRKVLHRRIAESLEERFPKHVESEPDFVARHCAAAGLNEKAVGHYQRAAELAVSRLSNQEASEYSNLALRSVAALPEDEERHQREIGVRLAQGEYLMALKGYEATEVVDTYLRVDQLREWLGEGPQQLPALIGLMRFHREHGDVLNARRKAEAILRIVEPLDVKPLLVLGHYIISGCAITTTSNIEAGEHLSEALAIAQTIDFPAAATPYDLDLISVAYAQQAIILGVSAKPDQAMESMRASRERLRRFGNDNSEATSLAVMSLAACQMEDPGLAHSTAEEALAIAEGKGFHNAEVMARVFRGWACASRGEIEQGVRDVERAFELAESSASAISNICIAAVNVYRMAKDLEMAEKFLEALATVTAHTGESRTYWPQILHARARIILELGSGDAREAEDLLLEALEGSASFGRVLAELIISTELAHLAPQTGKIREAHDRLADHYRRLTEGFDSASAKAARAALDDLAARLIE
jgi:class 3 adenylate cyclase/tetratricopeptide (TPR) repeat protein